MSVDVARLRRFAPVAVFIVTIGVGWMFFVRPVSNDRARVEDRLLGLRQRERALRAMVTEPSLARVATDPAATFERLVASVDPTAVVVERLARLASDARARDLFIETVEGAAATGVGAPPSGTYRRDPRFALFEQPLTFTTIRMSFETGYADLGRFLWSLRDLSTIVELRAFNVQPRLALSDEGSRETDGTLRASLTLDAYSRPDSARAEVAAVRP